MKKFLFFFVFVLVMFSFKEEKIIPVFTLETNKEIYDNYILEFDDCILSTNNFIDKFEYFNDKDFKILEIIPYHNLNETFSFYSNDIKYINNKFKNSYINLMIKEDKYTTNICIKSIKINTSNYILDNFKSIINFTY